MSVNNIEDILLYKINPMKISDISELLNKEFSSIVSFIFILSVLFCYLINFDFLGVLKRTVQAFIVISIYSSVLTGAKDFGMAIGNRIVVKDNFIFASWSSATTLARNGFRNNAENSKVDEEKGSWLNLGFNLNDLGTDAVGFMIWIISQLSIVFTQMTFTLAYYLILVSIPVIAIVNIFPMSSRALDGALVSILWIAITPIVFSIVVEILDGIVKDHVNFFSYSIIAKGILGIIFSLFIISTMAISYRVVSSGTIGESISGITQAFGVGFTHSGISALQRKTFNGLFKKGSELLVGSPYKSSILSQGLAKIDEGRTLAFEGRNKVLDARAPSASKILQNDSLQDRLKYSSSLMKDLTLSEKAKVVTGTIAKPIEALKVAGAKREAALKLSKTGITNQKITTGLAKDHTDFKERPLKRVIDSKVVKTEKIKDGPSRYHYDEAGNKRALGNKLRPVPVDGKYPKIFTNTNLRNEENSVIDQFKPSQEKEAILREQERFRKITERMNKPNVKRVRR